MQAHGQTTRDLTDPSTRISAREGSRHVDDAFIREHQLFVRRCLLRFGIAGADVDDAVQDVFMVALRHDGPFDVERSPRPWLYTVALNVSRNARRKRQRSERPMDELPEVPVAPQQEQSVQASEARSLVHRALDELPPAQRDVVLLHRLEGWPMEVVAETVGCPVATAHSRLRLGSARLDRAVRKHALRARVATLVAAFFAAFASPPVAAAATAAVVFVVVGAVVMAPPSEPPPPDPAPREQPARPRERARARTAPAPMEAAADEADVTPPIELPPAARPARPAWTAQPQVAAPAVPHVAPQPSPASALTAGPAAPPTASEPAAPASSAESAEDALVAETRMLARARALVRSSPAAARQALDDYDALFPQGQLHRERAAIERALATPRPQ